MCAKRRYVAAFLLLVAAVAVPPTAGAAPTKSTQTPSSAVDERLPAEALDALERDLGLAPAQLQTQADAGQVAETLEGSLGSSFGGAWLSDGEGTLTVAITDPSKADEVLAAGAQPEVVTHSRDTLDANQATLDGHQASAPDSIAGWYVDVITNSVVVLAGYGGVAAADEFVATAGVDPTAVQVEPTDEQPQLLYDVVGGDAFYTPDHRCSIGFSVQGGYVTAGHCGTAGTTTSGHNQVAQGAFAGSTFPGSDHAWVEANQDWVPQPLVNNYAGGSVTVTGSQEAPVGAAVCRSGSTTGWHCGTVLATNQTVFYPEGTVTGLTRTDVCAERGDSGGSFVWGSEAQGVTSGGSGSCLLGGTTYFQPLNPILDSYGLALVTG